MVRAGAAAVTVVGSVSELFAVLLSVADETVAVLLIVPAVAGAVTMIVIVAVVFFASVVRVQETAIVPVQVQPAPVADCRDVPVGIVSETVTFAASIIVEGFVTVMV
jgi:hypothetical protein